MIFPGDPSVLKLVHLGQYVGHVQLLDAAVDPLELHDALLVDQYHRAVRRAPFIVVDAVSLSDLALGVKVGQDRVRYVAQRGGKRGLRPPGVGANTQYLGILLLEIRVGLSERGDLMRSASGKGEDVEGQKDVLLPLVLAQSHAIAGVGGQREVWSGLSDVYHGRCASLN